MMNVMKTNPSVVAAAQLKQLNEFSRKLAHSSRRDKWVEKLFKLTEQEIHFVLQQLTGEQLAELILLLSPPRAGHLLCVMDSNTLNLGLAYANPRVVEKALRSLNEDELHGVFNMMNPINAERYRERLRWGEESVAAHMHTQRLALLESQTVVEAKEVLYESWGDSQARHRLYVVNQHGLLLGAIDPKALLMAHSDQALSDLIEPQCLTLDADLDQEQAARLLLEHNLSVLPVVHQQQLVGFFHLEEAVSILEKETTEDAEMQGGSMPLDASYLQTSPWQLWKKRIVWLLVLFVAEAYTGTVLRSFEEQLEAAIALAFFIPLLIGTGGNSGTQITTTIVRAMAVGEVSLRNLGTVLRKELSTSTLVALAMAMAAWIRAWTLGVGPEIGLVVMLTILAIVLWSALVSSVIPMVLRRMNVDPAVVSAPFIATLVDGTGLIIYFEIAKLILPELA
ncbi:magnesium transporter [Vibrio cholerae]|nr:magnesium transporter [Vibrio cholerae]